MLEADSEMEAGAWWDKMLSCWTLAADHMGDSRALGSGRAAEISAKL